MNVIKDPALEFQKVSKKYNSLVALKDINLKLEANEKVALLGCNGAGKSTFINLATGLRQQTSGEVFIFNTKNSNRKIKSQIGYLPQTLKFPSYLRLKEILKVVETHFNDKASNELLERLDLHKLLHRYCSGLSGGEERKLGLVLSLIGHRPLLILDEPTANVDLVAKSEIHKIIAEQIKFHKQTILFSSHEMSEVEKLAERVIVLNQGQVVADGNVQYIKKTFGSMTVRFIAKEEIISLKTAAKVEHTKNADNTYSYKVFGLNSDEIIKEIVEKKINFKGLNIEQTSLDDVFLKLWSKN